MKKTIFFMICNLCFMTNPLFANLTPTGLSGKELFFSNSLVEIKTSYGSGSGVVIGKIGSKIIIVTSKHVLEESTPTDEIDIFHSNSEYIGNVEFNEITKSKNYDLAILLVKNTSNECLIPADILQRSSKWLSNASTGTSVKVAGLSSPDSSISKKSSLRFSDGFITNILSETNSYDGYQMGYSSPTARGMSGGGVFAKGYHNPVLVGIHGRGESDEIRGYAKTGFNYAIPSNKIVDLVKFKFSNSFEDISFGNHIKLGTPSLNYPKKVITTICKDPFRGKWWCGISSNDKLPVNDHVCIFTNNVGERTRIVIREGKEEDWNPENWFK